MLVVNICALSVERSECWTEGLVQSAEVGKLNVLVENSLVSRIFSQCSIQLIARLSDEEGSVEENTSDSYMHELPSFPPGKSTILQHYYARITLYTMC